MSEFREELVQVPSDVMMQPDQKKKDRAIPFVFQSLRSYGVVNSCTGVFHSYDNSLNMISS